MVDSGSEFPSCCGSVILQTTEPILPSNISGSNGQGSDVSLVPSLSESRQPKTSQYEVPETSVQSSGW